MEIMRRPFESYTKYWRDFLKDCCFPHWEAHIPFKETAVQVGFSLNFCINPLAKAILISGTHVVQTLETK